MFWQKHFNAPKKGILMFVMHALGRLPNVRAGPLPNYSRLSFVILTFVFLLRNLIAEYLTLLKLIVESR